LNNQADTEKFTASMRASGVSEADIQQILSLPMPGTHSPADEDRGAEAKAYDLNNPAEKEQMADSLKANGIPEEDIQQIMRHSATEPPSPIEEVKGGEAKAYDLNNPADKEQMTASLRADGVSDEDAQKILTNVSGNEKPQNPPLPF
jgi:microsomal dipeptidase-like Zn-dependent dipeptidase